MTSTSGVRQVVRKGFAHCTHYIVPRAFDLTRAIQLGLCRTSCSKHVFRRFTFALGGARKDAPKQEIAQPINTTLRQSHNDLATCGQAASETRNNVNEFIIRARNHSLCKWCSSLRALLNTTPRRTTKSKRNEAMPLLRRMPVTIAEAQRS